MKAFYATWWFSVISWALLVVILAGGTFALVAVAFAHVDCQGCRPDLKEFALGLFIYGGISLLIVTVITSVSTAGRIATRWVVLPAVLLMIVLLVTSSVFLTIATPI